MVTTTKPLPFEVRNQLTSDTDELDLGQRPK